MRWHRTLWLLSMVALLASCGVRPRAVVKQDPASPSRTQAAKPAARAPVAAREHVVVRGDTLYGIAFRNSLDYRDLARWNGIAAPFTIHPGQRLRLAAPGTVVASSGNRGTTAPHPSATTPAVPARPASATPATQSSRATPAPSAPVVSSPAPATPVPVPTSTPATTPVIATGGSRTVEGIAWRWPATGQVISRFVAGEPTRQGIAIAGNAGQAVVAVADGEVVYSGSGLIGYGELIIVRHSDAFLSAYGHNRKRLVNEGQKVKAGQQIAEMGRSGASRDMLHFEIRKNGKPVDPLPFLPAR